MDQSMQKGRKVLIIIFLTLLLLSLISIIDNILLKRQAVVKEITFLGLDLILMYFTYKGYTWARWIFSGFLIIFGTIAVIGVIASLFLIQRKDVLLALVVLLSGLFNCFIGVYIRLSKDIKNFLDYQISRK